MVDEMTDKTLQQIDKLICSWLKQIDNVIPQLIMEMTTETKRHRFDLVTNVDKRFNPTTPLLFLTYFVCFLYLLYSKIIFLLYFCRRITIFYHFLSLENIYLYF